MGGRRFCVLASLLALIVAAGCASGGAQPPAPTQAAARVPAAFGEGVTTANQLRVTVTAPTRYKADPALLAALRAPAEAVPVQWAVTIRNGGGAEYDATPLNVSARTRTGVAPPLCDVTEGIDCGTAATIAPGATITVRYAAILSPAAETVMVIVRAQPRASSPTLTWAGPIT